MATNGNLATQEQFPSAPASAADAGSSSTGNANAGSNNLSKDEVGWFFVEQYYTTLSKSPEKLHLFYGKRSQFVYGLEAEVTNISVGRQAIQDRIAQLDFQDCKVRISNVDSQASFESIVIQVIGETSNKAAEPKKFVQTFVLAQQPSGYFVLNDILRYIDEESNEEPADAVEEAHAEEPETETADAPAPVQPEAEAAKEEASALDAGAVEQKLQETAPAPKAVADKNGPASETAAETKPAAAVAEQAADPEAAAREIEEEDVKEPEKPQDPTPTPTVKAAAPEPEPAVAEPAAPPKPMTWASRAAAAAGPRPVVPLPKTATPPAPAQSRAPAPAPAPAAAPAAAAAATPAQPSAAAATATATDSANKESSGWQTAGAESKRQNKPQSVSAAPIEKEGTMGYVKYVTEKVQEADLRNALAAHGELTYFDINRQKNCAFVEYKTVEGYQAAVSANPHVVNGENIVVEPRRPKSTAYGGSNYGSSRGGASGRGRGGFDGNRTGGQGNARGNYSGQNRGRGNAARGRGGSQAANA